MRYFLTGLIVGVLGIIISFLLPNSDMVMYALFIIGFIPIIISGLMSGAYVSGDRVRGNYSDNKDFNERSGMSTKFFLFGIPCVLAAIAVIYLKYNWIYELYKSSTSNSDLLVLYVKYWAV